MGAPRGKRGREVRKNHVAWVLATPYRTVRTVESSYLL